MWVPITCLWLWRLSGEAGRDVMEKPDKVVVHLWDGSQIISSAYTNSA